MSKTCKIVVLFLRLIFEFFLQLIDFKLITKVLGDPDRIQTCNPQSRNLIFYSVELRSQLCLQN